MNTAGVLDDYLEQLLGDAMPAPTEAPVPVAVAEVVDAVAATEAIEAGDAGSATGDAGVTEAAPAAESIAVAPGFDDLLDELRNDPLLSGAMPAPVDEARPSWDDLPPEVVYEIDPVATGADAPATAPAPAPIAAVPSARAPIARPMPSMAPMPPMPAATSVRAGSPSLAQSRPGSWEELQRQARDPASSPRENRRASERTSRWLRLRCGAQAYALELLKVQEVVLPVPLLPLRGTSPAMLGIMNLRGQVVPVMDLGIHLGSSAAGNDANTRIVVLEENGETMGLRVSAVEDVANLTDSQIEPPDTARICQISNDLFRGVARGGAQPMILLDATQLLN